MRSLPLLLSLLWVVVVEVYGANDAAIYNIMKLTKKGDHSHPIFSPDGRYIYFTAKDTAPNDNEGYGSQCEHVYQIDLQGIQLGDTNYQPKISLFSTGIGYENRVFHWGGDVQQNNYTIVSTFFNNLAKGYDSGSSNFMPVISCPQSPCDAYTTTDDLKTACNNKLVTEHYDGAYVLNFNSKGELNQNTKPNSGEDSWSSQKIRLGTQEVFSLGTEGNGETVYLRPNSDSNVKTASTMFMEGAYGGFCHSNSEIFFHGAKDGADKTKYSKSRITRLDGMHVYKSTFDAVGTTGTEMKPTSPLNDAYIYPQAIQANNKIAALATGIKKQADNTYRKDIYLLEVLAEAVKDASGRITTPETYKETRWSGPATGAYTHNSFHPSIDSTSQYIVFVSDRDGSNQLYLGTLKSETTTYTLSTTVTTPQKKTDGPQYIKDSYNFGSNFDTHHWPRLSKDAKKIIFTAGSCPQVYQINVDNNDVSKSDVSSLKKLSTGLHSYESPDFVNKNDDIVFAATLSRKFDNNEKLSKCSIQTCSESNEKYKSDTRLQELCKKAIKKYLPKDNDLFVANKLGIIKRRLSKANIGYNGEAKVSPSGDYVIYAAYDKDIEEPKDFQLYKVKIDGSTTQPQRLTRNRGFKFDVAIKDDNLIAYATNEYLAMNDKDNYTYMHNNEFTDVSRSEIHLLRLDTNPTQATPLPVLGGRAYSPVFIGDNKLIFLFDKVGITKQAIYGVEYKLVDNVYKIVGGPYEVSNITTNEPKDFIKKLEKAYDSNDIIFNQNGKIFLVQNFAPELHKERPVIQTTSTTKTTTTVTVPTSTTRKSKGSNFAFKSIPLNLIVFFAILLKLVH